ncbi:MAG: TlpA family protein disulfide reductase [Bacteroidota bacterium]|nr:TlpA family protein disulfide reductase [Bacteroidota bacterium]
MNAAKEKIASSDKDTETPTGLTPADYNFSLRTLRGEEVLMDSLYGKVIFMNFWATWCPPCIAEMPNIYSLYQKVKSDKIAFVMVSLDQDPAKAQQFIAKKGFTFPVYTPNGPLPSVYQGQVIPITFVISPDGKIVVHKEGMADYDNSEFREFLENLTQSREGLSNSKAQVAKSINSQ